jgi:hypothetical protein
MVLKSFISPNLRHKNGKIYYLNNKELYVSDWNYVEENYYIHFNDLEMNNSKNIKYTIKINDYSHDVLIEIEFPENMDTQDMITEMGYINSDLCGLDKNNDYYIFDINNIK